MMKIAGADVRAQAVNPAGDIVYRLGAPGAVRPVVFDLRRTARDDDASFAAKVADVMASIAASDDVRAVMDHAAYDGDQLRLSDEEWAARVTGA